MKRGQEKASAAAQKEGSGGNGKEGANIEKEYTFGEEKNDNAAEDKASVGKDNQQVIAFADAPFLGEPLLDGTRPASRRSQKDIKAIDMENQRDGRTESKRSKDQRTFTIQEEQSGAMISSSRKSAAVGERLLSPSALSAVVTRRPDKESHGSARTALKADSETK